MAINFKTILPLWKNEGLSPSNDLRNEGFKGGYKPPAHIFNWFWHLVTSAVNEIQAAVSGVDDRVSGVGIVYDADTHTIKLGESAHSTGGSGGGTGYVLTAATEDKLGGVKIGDGLDAEEDGKTSVRTISKTELQRIAQMLKNGGDDNG